jgi:hypothetical protein
VVEGAPHGHSMSQLHRNMRGAALHGAPARALSVHCSAGAAAVVQCCGLFCEVFRSGGIAERVQKNSFIVYIFSDFVIKNTIFKNL